MCEDCGSSIAGDQRYCLGCGARVGARSPQLQELLRRTREAGAGAASEGALEDAARAAASALAPQTAPAPVPPAAPPSNGLRLPPPRISALLVLVFLGFGVLLGSTAGSPVNDTLASVRSPVKLILPATSPAAAASTASSSTSQSGSSASSEAPSAEAEPTPTPAAKPAAKTPAKSSHGSGSSSEGGAGSEGSSGAGSSGSSEGASKGSSEAAASAPAKKLPPIKHVFVIMLADEPYAAVFGPASAAPYLTDTLEHQGELLPRYDAVAHQELANELALISGQGPTAETAANCPDYSEIAPTGAGADEQVLGSGCVYPAATQTLAGQLAAKGLTWHAYIEAIDEGGALGTCPHPALGQADPTAQESSSSGPYATFRNPFVYFASITGSPQCAADDVGLDKLAGDLASAKSTPSLSYIVPDRCHDGNPTPCNAGAPAGLAPANAFLKQVVPEITASKAYRESGLLVITVDQAPSSGAFADSSSCCGQPLFPNAPAKTLTGAPSGGGAVGALLLSPYVKAATTSQEPYNHFSLLRTIEDLFRLPHLGYAGLSAVKSFEPAMFTAGKG
jgi:phosphatidylinositol-3-phosphatase